jgi:TonB-dependent SusC/RagA subfamily outer membrane receptor
MDSFLIYLLQVTAVSIMLYICFLIFYRNDTFYQRNRVILVMSILLPVLFPVFSLGAPETEPGNSLSIIFIDRVASAGQNIQSSLEGGIRNINVSNILFMLWITGTSLLIIRTTISLVRTFSIISKAERTKRDSIKIVISDLSHPPFSFWPYAVIPRNIYDSAENIDIIKHEEYHIRQIHTADLVLSEIFIAFFWFNPAAWLLKRSIVLNHEYLADNKTIHETSSIREYQYLLVNLASGISQMPMIHNFNTNIKNRIVMINQKPTNRIAVLKNIMILPIILFIFFSFSFRNNTTAQQENKPGAGFSPESQKAIMEFIFRNIVYPVEARERADTGRIVVILRTGRNGTLEIVDTYSTPDPASRNSKYSKILMFKDIVVMGYAKKMPDEGIKSSPVEKKELLKQEGKRVAMLLSNLDLPEWKNETFEFGIPISFKLKFPDKPASSQYIDEKLKELPDNAIIMIDGKEVTVKQYESLDPDNVSTVSILKDQSATAVFGEKGKNGVIMITTKK